MQSTDFTVLWAVIYFSILVNIAFLKPFATSLYETDEEETCCKKVIWIIIEVIISVAVFGVFVGVGWVLWGYIFIPIK